MPFKRVLLTALTLLAVLALGVPWWIGRDAERRYREFVEAVNAGGAPIEVALESYARGWFASRATLGIAPRGDGARPAFRALGAGADDPALVLRARVAHGLFPVGASGAGSWRPALALVEGELGAGGSNIASLRYRIPPTGGLELVLRSARGGADEPGIARWRDVELAGTLPGGAGEARLSIEAGLLAVPAGDGRLIGRDLDGVLHLALPAEGLPEGTLEANARALTLAGRGGDRALGEVEGVELRGRLERQGATASAALRGRVDKLASRRQAYGPGRMRVTVRDLHAGSLARLAGSTIRLARLAPNRRALGLSLAGSLMAEAPRLLAHGPAAKVDELSLETPDGEFTGTGRLALDTADPVVLNNPFLLQRAVTGRLELKCPPVVAEHAALIHLRRSGRLGAWGSPEAWLAGQVDRGRLLRRDGFYRISVRLDDGRIRVNDRPWSALEP